MPQCHISMEIQAPFHHVTSQARRRGPGQRVGPYMIHWNAHECASCICARLLEVSNRLYHLCWRLACLCQVRPSCDKHSMVSEKPLGSGRGCCRVRLSGSIILKVCPVSANTSERTSIGFSPTQAPRRLHQYIQCFVLKEIIHRMAWPAVWCPANQ